MPSIRDSRTVAAATTVTNILSGSKFEFMPQAAAILVYAVQDLATGGPVLMDVTFGNVVEGDQIVVPQATVGLGPDIQNHLVASGVAAPGGAPSWRSTGRARRAPATRAARRT